eukprot:6212773-Pleurochrysis_carterae.AAC.5
MTMTESISATAAAPAAHIYARVAAACRPTVTGGACPANVLVHEQSRRHYRILATELLKTAVLRSVRITDSRAERDEPQHRLNHE